MTTKLDARQTISRDTLAQIVNAADKELDDILRAIDSELTSPFAMTENAPADRVVNIGAITITNSETGRTRSIPPISNLIPTFAGGTITIDATGAGNATPSSGTAVALGMSASQFLKLGVSIDPTGAIVLQAGTAGASEAAATNPPIVPNTHSVGYIVIETNGSNDVQNIEAGDIFQYVGGGAGGSGSGDASSVITRLWDTFEDSIFTQLSGVDFSSDQDSNVDTTNSTGAYSLVTGTFEFSSAAQTMRTTQLLSADEFLNPKKEIGKTQLVAFWDEGKVDTAATYELSVDGGDTWSAVSMSRVGNASDAFAGELDLLYNAAADQISETTTDGTADMDVEDAFAQQFTLAGPVELTNIRLRGLANGAPTGNFTLTVQADNSGEPGSVVATSTTTLDVSTVGGVAEDLDFAFGNDVVEGGTYWIVLTPDGTYNGVKSGSVNLSLEENSAGSGFSSFNGAVWTDTTNGMVHIVTGKETGLFLRITSSASDVALVGYGLFYDVEGITQAGEKLVAGPFKFQSNSAPASFPLTWNGDPELLNVRLAETGQSFSPATSGDSNGFVITGSTLTFPGVDFSQDVDQEFTLWVTQSTGTADTSSSNASRLSNEEDRSDALGAKTTSHDQADVELISVPHTFINSRAPIRDISKIPSAKMGIERIYSGADGERVYGESLGSREKVWKSTDPYDRIRYFSAGTDIDFRNNISNGYYISMPGNSYVEVTFYGTGLNVLSKNTGDSVDCRATVDGGAEGANFMAPTSGTMNNRGYKTNNVDTVVEGLAQGLHTVRIRVVNGLFIYGWEIVNDVNQLSIPAGSVLGDDERYTLPATLTDYNAGFDAGSDAIGTRGGRVLVYAHKEPTTGVTEVRKRFKAVDARNDFTGSIDHSNEEITGRFNWRQFQANRADDFHDLDKVSADNAAFTLDDGTTTLVGGSVRDSNQELEPSSGGFIEFTFVGSGLDIELGAGTGSVSDPVSVFIDGVDTGGNLPVTDNTNRVYRIASGLEYGTHTVRFSRDSFVSGTVTFKNFLVYGPKKPDLPANSTELASYNIMADFSFSGLNRNDAVSSGVLRKDNTREMLYNGSWSISFNSTLLGGSHTQTSTNGDSMTYSFFGTGFVFRHRADTNRSANILVQANGQTLNTTNFPGIATQSSDGNIGFNTGTGIMDCKSAGVLEGTEIAVTGMPLAFYTITFTLQDSDFILPSAIDVITPIHMPEADRNLTRDDLVGSNSLQSDVALPGSRKGKASFPNGVDLGPNSYKWQKKILTSNITSNNSDVDEIRFSGLEIGKSYRVTLQAMCTTQTGTNGSSGTLRAYNGSDVVVWLQFQQLVGGGSRYSVIEHHSEIFTATDPVMRIDAIAAGGFTFEAGADGRTFVQLEELPNHKETNEW